MIAVENLRNVLVESVNARDPSRVDEADLPATADVKAAVETIGERWPRVMMTRGDIGERPVAVVWMPDRNERYRKVAHVELIPGPRDLETDYVEGIDPDLIAEDPPSFNVAEWESSSQVDQGNESWI